MTRAADMPDPATIAPAAMRGDLVEREQMYLGRAYVVFKNPISLGYFRLPVAHVEAARMFDGRITLGEMVEKLRESSQYWRGMSRGEALKDLLALAQQMGAAGLLRVRASSAGDRARRLREAKKAHRFEFAVGQVLYFKKTVFDPNRLLERLMPSVEWIFTWPVMTACALFVLLTLGVAVGRWDTITVQGANFFTLQNLGLSWVLFIGVKVVHEFGHAFTCKRHGGEVHEMGFMFILFTPYLFCNVSDSWLAQKRARIATTAAGIVVELFLASVATWLWLFSQPGLFHQMCFNTMALCSISTVIFNANPLMKFDGYYIMTDLLEVPNLRAKSNAWITNWAQRRLLGMKSAARRLAGYEVGPLFGIYAVAAYAYGWFITYKISVKMFDMLEPYGLQIISRTYVGLFLFVSLALPLWRLGRTLRGSAEFYASGIPRLRFAGLALLVLGALLFVTPWQETIKRAAALEHGKIAPVSSPLPGFLREVNVSEGQRVHAGELLGRLDNPEIESRIADLRLQRESAVVRHRAALSNPTTEARLNVPVLEKFVSEADEEIKAMDERVARLALRAPMDGVVRTKRPGDLLGLHFAPGQPVIEIGDVSSSRLIIAVDEKQARRVAVGQKVAVRFDALPGRTFHGAITVAPVSPSQRFSVPAFANLFGGDVPSEPDARGNVVPSLPHYEAEARIEIPPDALAVLRAQSSAHARVGIRSTTLGLFLCDRALDMVDPNVRL
jgi:putative peptide zinc metalloprotease protein